MFYGFVKRKMGENIMKRNLHDPDLGKLKVVGLISGSGNTLWKVFELQKELEATWEGSPFEVVGCFSSDPMAKGVEIAQSLGIPIASLDIRAFYKERGKKISDREVRREYDHAVLNLIAPFEPDVILLAGYVWAVTEVVLDHYTVVNVHPADLTVMKDGRKAYAGANGVGDALAAHEDYLHASSHLATSALDSGPVFFVSPGVEVDYALASSMDQNEFIRTYLNKVNAQSRLIAARTIYEIALGHFELDQNGSLFYKGRPLPNGFRIKSWDENKPLYERHIEALLKPSSIAVIGASAKGGIGHAVVKNIQSAGYSGQLAVVNRNADTVLGVPGYQAVNQIPHDVDMAVIATPSSSVLSVVEDCGKKGVKAIVCIAAGFKETGDEGAEAEAQLKAIVDKYNMRMIGPNCMGISNTNPAAKLNATILHDIPVPGNIAFVTQSGGLGAVLLDYSKHLGIGFSAVVSLGNQTDVTVNDLLPMLAEDNCTKVILLYLETIPDYRRFRRLAAKVSQKKPIIALKAGRTEAGARAASSHTGSLAGDDRVMASLLESAGIIRADTIYSAFFMASVLSKIERPRGRRIAVVTNGGGPGILASDAFSRAGFELPPLPQDNQKRLKEILLPEASCGNPIDLVATAPPAHYVAAIQEVMHSGKYDGAALLCIPPATINTADVAKSVVAGMQEMDQSIPRLPLLSCFFGPNLGAGARDILNAAGYPCLEYPEQIAEILVAIQRQKVPSSPAPLVRTETSKAARMLKLMHPDKNGYLPQQSAWAILEAWGFAIAKPVTVVSRQELAAAGLNYPVVAKIDHPEIIHKSDVGGVILNVRDQKSAAEVLEELLAKFPGARGVTFQQQIKADTEMILGAVRDDAAGAAVVVGLGGKLVEVLKDISFIHVPFAREDARRAILSLKSAPLLTGYRGSRAVNLDSLLDQMELLNRLLIEFADIREIDLNPLMYSAKDDAFIITDCRIRMT